MNSLYPLWIEKLVFIGLISLGVFLGIILKSHLDGPMLIFSWICGIPLIVLVMTEGLGRAIQSALSK